MAKYVGELEKTCSAIWRKRVRRFGENVFGDLEKNVFDDLEKTCLAKTLEIWRNVVDVVMAISYWSSLWSS